MRPTALIFAAFAFLFGCPPTTTKPVSPTFVHVPDTDQCPAMCAHLRTLKCAEGTDYYDNDKPGPKGVPNATCEEFCERQQTNGVYENPRCLAQVPTCAQIEEWRQHDCKGDGGV